MTVIDAVPLKEIEAEASQVEVDFGRMFRLVIAALFYWLARCIGAAIRGVGRSVAFCWTAWKIGYRDGRRRADAGRSSGR